MKHFNARRGLLAAACLGLLGLTACRKASKPAVVACEPLAQRPITKKILLDRTTVLPESQADRLAAQLEQWPSAHDHVQLLCFGGVMPSLVEEAGSFQLPAQADDPQTSVRERWVKPPAQIRRERDCSTEHRQALQMQAHLAAAMRDVDASVKGRSPNFEAIYASVHEWHGPRRELMVVCDGVEHLLPSRTFYRRGAGLSLPDPVKWVEQLKSEGLLPDLNGVRVYHLAIGLSELAPDGKQRGLRPYSEVQALKRLWSAYWIATGAAFSFGEPLFVDGLGA